MNNYLGNAAPGIAANIPKVEIATLPTPVSYRDVRIGEVNRRVYVKHDDQTNAVYGGNKVRKLEYILGRALDEGAKRVITFGAAGSNHALATAIHAKQFNLDCTCFLSNQRSNPKVSVTLAKHVEIGSEIIGWRRQPVNLKLLRNYFRNPDSWVIPLGGTCWYGSFGFVNAGLELAAQIKAGELECPSRVYVANGTMGTAAGLALGFALADLPCELHTVRVTATVYANPIRLQHLLRKIVNHMRRLDGSVPYDLAARTRVVWRDDFFAGGYAHFDEPTTDAVNLAADKLGIKLETTYTGKAMAALIQDASTHDGPVLFWNTYNSNPIEIPEGFSVENLPEEFRRYFR